MEHKLYENLVFRRQNSSPDQIKKLVSQNGVSECFLALSYIVHGDVKTASLIIDSLDTEINTRYCQEAKMLIASALREDSEAINIASGIIRDYPDAVFAHYLLGYSSAKAPEKALEHYHAILQIYPDFDNVKLQIAEKLTYLKKYTQALKYTKECKPSMKSKMYQLLIPLNTKKYKILLFTLSILLAGITDASLIIWGGITISIIAGIIVSLMKSKGTLIANRLILLEIIITISWVLIWGFR